MKKKNVFLIVIIVVLLLLCVGMGTFIFINKDKLLLKESPKTKEENPVVITDEIKSKLERFINAASHFNDDEIVTATYFNKGVTNISKQMKLKMVYNDVVDLNGKDLAGKYEEITDDELSGIQTSSSSGGTEMWKYVGLPIGSIKISDFDNIYKQFFNEEAKYTIDELIDLGCPFPVGINKEYDKIYLSDRCGGTVYGDAAPAYSHTIVSYDVINNNYVVEQIAKDKLMYNNGAVETLKTYNIVWTFDKNLNFISTEVK